MLKIRRELRKKKQSLYELSVIPIYIYGLFNSLHGSSQESEEFDHFNTVFIRMGGKRSENKLHIFFHH